MLSGPIYSGFHIGVRVNRTRMTLIERIDTDAFLVLSAMIRRIRVIRVLLMHTLLRTPIADPVYAIENRSSLRCRWFVRAAPLTAEIMIRQFPIVTAASYYLTPAIP